MKMRGLAALLVASWAGCRGAPPPPVTDVYGEVHLHHYATGTHPAALFVAPAIPVAAVQGDSVLQQVTLPARMEGPCTLVLPSACAPPCGPSATFVDAGAVHLRGERGGTLDLTYHASQFSYQPVQALAPGTVLFAGGERVTVTGDGAEAPAFTGAIRVAEPLVLEGPAALPWPAGAPFEVAWTVGRGDRIQLVLLASTRDGLFSTLTCNVPDDAGRFTLPAGLIAALPAPPRDLRLEVSRDDFDYGNAGRGLGVIVHAGSSLSLSGHED